MEFNQYKANAMKKLEQLQVKFEKDMKNAQEDFFEAYQNVLANADILLKRQMAFTKMKTFFKME